MARTGAPTKAFLVSDAADLSELKDVLDDLARAGSAKGTTFVVVPVREPAPVKPAARARLGQIKVAREAAGLYDVRPKLANAVRALGNNTVADLLGVSRSQPGRWVRGEEGISGDNQAAILDLDFVLSVLLRTMSPATAGIWLVSPNEFLNGARPVDALRLDGHRHVVDAIQAYAEGAFA